MTETGAALAVFAMLVFSLLAPLHLSAGLHRDLGWPVVGIGGWTLCSPTGDDSSDRNTPTALRCPAVGVGKGDLGLAPPTDAGLRLDIGPNPPPPPSAPETIVTGWGGHGHLGEARAPPPAA